MRAKLLAMTLVWFLIACQKPVEGQIQSQFGPPVGTNMVSGSRLSGSQPPGYASANYLAGRDEATRPARYRSAALPGAMDQTFSSSGNLDAATLPDQADQISPTKLIQPVPWRLPDPEFVMTNGVAGYRSCSDLECEDRSDQYCDDACDSADRFGGNCRLASNWQWFGELLWLRPRNAEVVHAVPYDASASPPPGIPIQAGRTGIADYNYDPAFRVGFVLAINDRAAMSASYTRLESHAWDRLAANIPFQIRSTIAHPQTPNAGTSGSAAAAAAGIDLDLLEVDYRRQFACGECYSLSYLAGARYVYLEQGFASRFGSNNQDTVLSDIRFDGGGIRFGLEGERQLNNRCLSLYGSGVVSFVVGEFDAIYTQGQSFDASLVNTRWSAGRIVPIVDLELGVSFTGPRGRVRYSGGYMVSIWGNVAKTDDFIRAVQTNNFVDLGNTLSFDGLVVRAEYRF